MNKIAQQNGITMATTDQPLKKPGIILDWKATLGTIVSALIIGAATFAWKVNSTLARMEEHYIQDGIQRNDMKQDINEIKLDIRELRSEKAIRDSQHTN